MLTFKCVCNLNVWLCSLSFYTPHPHFCPRTFYQVHSSQVFDTALSSLTLWGLPSIQEVNEYTLMFYLESLPLGLNLLLFYTLCFWKVAGMENIRWSSDTGILSQTQSAGGTVVPIRHVFCPFPPQMLHGPLSSPGTLCFTEMRLPSSSWWLWNLFGF